MIADVIFTLMAVMIIYGCCSIKIPKIYKSVEEASNEKTI